MSFLVCIECSIVSIPAPAGATNATRFTCRECTHRLSKKKLLAADIEEITFDSESSPPRNETPRARPILRVRTCRACGCLKCRSNSGFTASWTMANLLMLLRGILTVKPKSSWRNSYYTGLRSTTSEKRHQASRNYGLQGRPNSSRADRRYMPWLRQPSERIGMP